MKGYLYVQTVAHFERASTITDYDAAVVAIPSSLEGRGWIPIAEAIKQGDFLKLSAERHGIHYRARFNVKNNVPKGNNGCCEIRGGPLACVGTFVNVRPEASPEFKLFFVCHSSSGDGRFFLRWQIGVNDFVDADSLRDED